MNLRAQSFYEPETQKKIRHKTPKKERASLRPQNFSEFKEILWTQHQMFNEPKAPKKIWT